MRVSLPINQKILDIANAEHGVKEIQGKQHNGRILQYAQDLGWTWIDDDETPWCAIFMAWVLLRAGFDPNALGVSAAAQSFLKVGTEVALSDIKPGDLCIFWRESPSSWKGHVGVFVRMIGSDRMAIRGGNQNNECNISIYPTSRLKGIRRLTSIHLPVEKLEVIETLVVPEEKKEPALRPVGFRPVLMEFLKAKQTQAFKDDVDKFEKYPYYFTHKDKLTFAYIQDAEERISDTTYELILVLMNKARTQTVIISRKCIAPVGCVINWDNVHCAYNISL